MAASGRTDPAVGNLALELGSFVGRAHELTEIRRLLAVSHTVTLTGPGGVGKSRLALRAAHELGRHFSNGVWWVELADVETPDLVVQGTARSLGVFEQPGVAIDDVLVTWLRDRHVLLVLDNCEHLVDACREMVSAIVSRCEGVRVLCTTRQRLGVPGETIVVVSPLDVPAPGRQLTLAALGHVDALTLLVERARAVAPDFALTEENAAAPADVCRRLDGMPLAIELAAVRLASLSTDDLIARLDDRFRLLTNEREPRSRRHQALRTTVEWSEELLGDDERILWRRVSVFAGSFGLDAAEAVCSGDGLEPDRIVDLLASLVERSILTMGQGSRQGRYRLLETMRLYGAERLCEAGEEAVLERRHAAWFAEVVSGGDRPWWTDGARVEVIDALDLDWANIEAALDHCARARADAQMGLRMASDLWAYWLARGRYRVGFRHLQKLLDLDPTPGPVRVFALWALGWLGQATGDHEVALEAFEAVRRVSEQTGADRELAYALMGSALIRLRRGELTAVELLRASLAVIEPVDDAAGRGLVTFFLGTALAVGGEWSEAAHRCRAELDATPERDTMIRSLLSTLVGIIEWQCGDLDAADARLAEGLRIQDRAGHLWGFAISLDAMAWVAASSGRFDRAARLLGAVASVWEELGIVPVPYWQAHHHECEEVVRRALDEARYRSCAEQGFALDRSQRAALALHDDIPASSSDGAFTLTKRELDVAHLVADGLSNPAIASALFVSVATVKTHVSHILQKLALDSRVQLAAWAVSAGLPDPALDGDR